MSIPGAIASFLDRAGLCDIKTVLYICTSGGECEVNDIATAIGFAVDEVNMSLAFWRGAGILTVSDKPNAEKSTPQAKNSDQPKNDADKTFESPKKITRTDKLPEYTAKELAGIIEARREVAPLITEGQNIMGKIFTVHEVNILIGLLDYLGLDNEYILMLLKHCAEIGKKHRGKIVK